jgi:parallel beta-helix repeat protein
LTLRGGTYTQPLRSGDVWFPSGTSWQIPITIQGAPGATVTLTQDVNIQANSDGSPVSYLILRNLHTQTFRVGDASTGVRLEGSDVTGGVVITKTTEDIQLVGNTIHDAGVVKNDAYAVSTGTYGCYCNGHHMLIEDSIFRHNTGYALHLYLSGGTVDNAIVRRNTFIGNAYDDGGRNLTLGVVILAGSNNLFCGNTMTDNPTLHGGPAVSAINGSGNVIVGNTISGTNGPAIELNDSALGTVVAGNQLKNNQGGIVGPGMASMVTTTTVDCTAPLASPPLAPVAQKPPAPTHLRLLAILP